MFVFTGLCDRSLSFPVWWRSVRMLVSVFFPIHDFASILCVLCKERRKWNDQMKDYGDFQSLLSLTTNQLHYFLCYFFVIQRTYFLSRTSSSCGRASSSGATRTVKDFRFIA